MRQDAITFETDDGPISLDLDTVREGLAHAGWGMRRDADGPDRMGKLWWKGQPHELNGPCLVRAFNYLWPSEVVAVSSFCQHVFGDRLYDVDHPHALPQILKRMRAVLANAGIPKTVSMSGGMIELLTVTGSQDPRSQADQRGQAAGRGTGTG